MTNYQRDGQGWYIYDDNGRYEYMPSEVETAAQAKAYFLTGQVISIREAIMAELVDPIVDWVTQAESFLVDARSFLNKADAINLYFENNDVGVAVLTALMQGPETAVGNSVWSAQKAANVMCLMNDFQEWRKAKLVAIETALPDGTPLTITPADVTRQKAIVSVKVS